jgi:cyclopropane fatty-acyl-phospholipid synthase-like methyltransferase
MIEKPDAPAARRNRDAILEVLRDVLGRSTSLLEIGSGTGQHAVYFGQALPALRWQTSDRSENHAGILAWVDEAGLDNVVAPLEVDVLRRDRVDGRYDAVFSANTAHIMSFQAVVCMFRLVGAVLNDGGVFCLYGPFNVNGEFTSASNERFNESLKLQNPEMGIRDLADLNGLAVANGLSESRRYAMPANNMLIVWRGLGDNNGHA